MLQEFHVEMPTVINSKSAWPIARIPKEYPTALAEYMSNLSGGRLKKSPSTKTNSMEFKSGVTVDVDEHRQKYIRLEFLQYPATGRREQQPRWAHDIDR